MSNATPLALGFGELIVRRNFIQHVLDVATGLADDAAPHPHLCLDRPWRWRRLMGMKQILLILPAMVLVGCGTTKVDPNAPANITDPFVEEQVRLGPNTGRVVGTPNWSSKLKGELTKADLEKVIYLDLKYKKKITDAGLKDVAKLQNLTTLYLDRTQITDAGLVEVAKLQKLKVLGLSFTKITDAGLKEVAKLQKLTFLRLGNTPNHRRGPQGSGQVAESRTAWLGENPNH